MPPKYQSLSYEELDQIRDRLARLTSEISSIQADMQMNDIKSVSVLWSNADRDRLLKLLQFSVDLRAALNLKLDQKLLGLPDIDAKRERLKNNTRKHRAKKKGTQETGEAQ
jgi:hypothetical protein